MTLVDVDPARAAVAPGARGRLRPARRRAARTGRGRPHERDVARASSSRSTCSRRRARCSTSAGTATERVHLALGGAFHSRRLALRASQVGAVAAARRGSRTHADRLALALDLLRDPAFDALLTGESPLRRAARRDAPRWPPGACRRSATPSATRPRRSDAVFTRDRPRPHDGGPQLHRRGLRPGPAPARCDVRRGRELPRPRARTRTGSSSTSAAPSEVLHEVLGALTYRNLDDEAGVRRHQHLHRGARPGRSPTGSPSARAGLGPVRADRGHAARVARRLGRATRGTCDRGARRPPRRASTTRSDRAGATSTTAGSARGSSPSAGPCTSTPRARWRDCPTGRWSWSTGWSRPPTSWCRSRSGCASSCWSTCRTAGTSPVSGRCSRPRPGS